MATHCSVLAWRIPGTGEPGGLPSMGSHRVGDDRSGLAAAAAAAGAYPFFVLNVQRRFRKLGSMVIAANKKIGERLPLSHFSRVRLCATPETAAPQAPPSLGFSRQGRCSGLPFPSPMHESESEVVPDSSRPHGLQPTRLLRPWDSPGKSTGVGCHCLLRSPYPNQTQPVKLSTGNCVIVV